MNMALIKWSLIALLFIVFVFSAVSGEAPSLWAEPLSKAMADTPPAAEKGYLDIPGAPNIDLLTAFLWAVWVGWIFSTVGAFGGIMAGVGHITIFGLGDYARSFKDSDPALNRLLTDSIRVSNQWLVSLSAMISSIDYYRMGRLVLPLGIALAAGSVTGSIIVPLISAGKIKLSEYIGYFGICVLAIGGFMFYETTSAGMAKRKKAADVAKAIEVTNTKIKNNEEVDKTQTKVRILGWNLRRVSFTFYGVEFSFSPIIAALGGFFIAALASFLGIGGGFLFVPYLTSVAGLPMFLVAGTSALTVFIGMIVSIISYMFIGGVIVYWPMIGLELLGIFIGSLIGPYTSKYIPNIWLKRIFVLLALYVGIRYTSKGFLGHSIVPPF